MVLKRESTGMNFLLPVELPNDTFSFIAVQVIFRIYKYVNILS
jgi:hypothetical protein